MDVTKANLGLNRPSLLLWLFLFFVIKICYIGYIFYIANTFFTDNN